MRNPVEAEPSGVREGRGGTFQLEAAAQLPRVRLGQLLSYPRPGVPACLALLL